MYVQEEVTLAHSSLNAQKDSETGKQNAHLMIAKASKTPESTDEESEVCDDDRYQYQYHKIDMIPSSILNIPPH